MSDRESGAGAAAATEDADDEEEEKLFGKFFERKTERERKAELGIFDYGEGLMIIFLSFPPRRLRRREEKAERKSSAQKNKERLSSERKRERERERCAGRSCSRRLRRKSRRRRRSAYPKKTIIILWQDHPNCLQLIKIRDWCVSMNLVEVKQLASVCIRSISSCRCQ